MEGFVLVVMIVLLFAHKEMELRLTEAKWSLRHLCKKAMRHVSDHPMVVLVGAYFQFVTSSR